MIAALIGSTGLTGRAALDTLLNDPSITQVITISRRPSQNKSSKLREILISDLSELSTHTPELRADLYLCCLGTTLREAGSREAFTKVDYTAVVAFAKIALANEAKSFALVSSMGADAKSLVFYSREKGRTEDSVKALGLKSLLIFRPGFLNGRREKFRFAEAVLTKILVPVSHALPARMGHALVTDIEPLAKRMVTESKLMRSGTRVISSKEI